MPSIHINVAYNIFKTAVVLNLVISGMPSIPQNHKARLS